MRLSKPLREIVNSYDFRVRLCRDPRTGKIPKRNKYVVERRIPPERHHERGHWIIEMPCDNEAEVAYFLIGFDAGFKHRNSWNR